MAHYLLKRLLLMIPTLLGIMLISFIIVQFVPGGPVERMIAQLQGHEVVARRVRIEVLVGGDPHGDVGRSGGKIEVEPGLLPGGGVPVRQERRIEIG